MKNLLLTFSFLAIFGSIQTSQREQSIIEVQNHRRNKLQEYQTELTNLRNLRRKTKKEEERIEMLRLVIKMFETNIKSDLSKGNAAITIQQVKTK